MTTQPKKKVVLKADIEQLVISDLKKQGQVLLTVIDRDSQAALQPSGDHTELIISINVNLRILAAINEVLLYYGDAGVFMEGLKK